MQREVLTRGVMSKMRFHNRLSFTALLLFFLSGPLLLPQKATAQPLYLDDTEISSAVRAALGRDELIQANLVKVQTVEGVVMLDGTVDNLLAQRRAGQVAETVAGVRAVINRINVIPLARTDEELRRDVLLALSYTPYIQPSEVQAVIQNETVLLNGKVNSPAKKALIEDTVAQVRGVTAIQNDIVISQGPDRLDGEIADEIKARLKHDVLVDAPFIDVLVNNGHVKLTGMVKSADQKRRAFQDALVAGVKSIDVNDLQVNRLYQEQPPVRQPMALPSDEALAEAVTASLQLDPRIPEGAVAVDVSSGVVTVTGQVDTLATKRAVEQNIREVAGVSHVLNNVQLDASRPISDTEIERRIEDALLRNPDFDYTDIEVSVTEGRVVLTGIAEYPYQLKNAEEIASRMRGVREVIDKIVLQPPSYEPAADP